MRPIRKGSFLSDCYPFHGNLRWDSWGRCVGKSTAYHPWIWTAGDQELVFSLEIKQNEVLCCKYTSQFNWLEQEFPKINRAETPSLVVLLHSPGHNSINNHYMEGESMRVAHITDELSTPVKDSSAPVYITIGDGGNIEGIANSHTEPRPSYSAFQEASFGHATLEIKNRTRAYYTWHRNHDSEAVSLWLYNRHWLLHISVMYPASLDCCIKAPQCLFDAQWPSKNETIYQLQWQDLLDQGKIIYSKDV
ncbi:purple acid phosphatase 10-like [Populus alba]|uniref:purple acid phosphatase 10-like n=1 Tax=Populus alba TaxID=43335 RepID=UPI001588D5DA|nr:purple acid phosphatase 10-like [Populus alba]